MSRSKGKANRPKTRKFTDDRDKEGIKGRCEGGCRRILLIDKLHVCKDDIGDERLYCLRCKPKVTFVNPAKLMLDKLREDALEGY